MLFHWRPQRHLLLVVLSGDQQPLPPFVFFPQRQLPRETSHPDVLVPWQHLVQADSVRMHPPRRRLGLDVHLHAVRGVLRVGGSKQQEDAPGNPCGGERRQFHAFHLILQLGFFRDGRGLRRRERCQRMGAEKSPPKLSGERSRCTGYGLLVYVARHLGAEDLGAWVERSIVGRSLGPTYYENLDFLSSAKPPEPPERHSFFRRET